MNQAGRAFRRGADEQTSSEAKSKDILKAQLEAEREIQLLTLKQQEDEENAKLRQHAEATDKRTAELARIEKLPLDELREELARRNVALPSDEQPREARRYLRCGFSEPRKTPDAASQPRMPSKTAKAMAESGATCATRGSVPRQSAPPPSSRSVAASMPTMPLALA